MSKKFSIFYLFAILMNYSCYLSSGYEALNSTNDSDLVNDQKVLSRRKRFIIFPEGSSFQLVFCNTFPMISPVGDIMLFGYTAALAWELPQDPYSPFMHHADPLHRRVDTKTLYYTDNNGKVLFKKPFQKKPIVNPAFAKRSVEVNMKIKKAQIDRNRMHAEHKRELLKVEQMNEQVVEFHRNSRVGLFEKIESLLQGLGANGRQCILKTLCLIGQSKNSEQTSFLEEIIRTIFTLPKGKEFNKDHYKEYDIAHRTSKSCEELYPECVDVANSEMTNSIY